MSARFKLTPQAEADLDQIADYLLAEAGTAVAVRIVTEIRDEFRKLSEMPGMGHYNEDLLDSRHRFWTMYSYLIVYRWQTSPIQIIAVVHGARDLPGLFRRRRLS
jgi:antitoxin ParD1/3/4/toxin ParE1/3/4